MSTLTTPRILPTALVVGPQKAGTTWIHNYLKQFRDVTLPRNVKETFFFDRYYGRGLHWYERQFAKSQQSAAIIEVAPTYFQSEEVSARVSRDLGRIPIVCTLRDPVARTFSHYIHMRRYGMTELAFREAMKQFPEILDSSQYGRHIERWKQAVGEENVHILVLEQLRDNPEEYTRALCKHLRLEYRPIPIALHEKVNESMMPKHHVVARAGWKTATMLRGLGYHPLVEIAKKLGMKKLFFGSSKSSPVPTLEPRDRDWLRQELRGESHLHATLVTQDLGAVQV